MNIEVMGERCSGTNWLAQLIQTNFECSVVRWLGKHFRYPEWPEPPARTPDLVFVIVRERFSWLQSFHRMPHHVPEAVGVPFRKFIRMPIRSYMGPHWDWHYGNWWARRRLKRPEWLMEEHPDPLALRKDKLEYYLGLQRLLPSPVVYVTLEGLSARMDQLTEVVECPLLNERVLPVIHYKGKPEKGTYRPKEYELISESDRQWIDEHTDFEMEERYRAACLV